MNIQSLKQQAIGVVNLSLPILCIYLIFPATLHNLLGRLIVALCIGTYVYYLGNKITKTQANSLLYAPTGTHKEHYDTIIAACKLDPRNVQIRYGYTNEMIAMTMFNTVTVDPLYVNQPDQDPEMERVRDILDKHVVISLSEEQKGRTQKIKEIYSPQVQQFIFKHELAHVAHNYSQKKLYINGLIGAISAFVGINAALLCLSLNGYVAILVGMIVGGTVDLLLSYVSNALFTASHEKQADFFAAQHCSKDEILAAADFFEKHQLINDQNNSNLLLTKIPATILTGHHNGIERAKYLRQLIK